MTVVVYYMSQMIERNDQDTQTRKYVACCASGDLKACPSRVLLSTLVPFCLPRDISLGFQICQHFRTVYTVPSSSIESMNQGRNIQRVL